ncbi:MAG: MBOAT family protein [Planctomycetes bacterium]|nr:MBOAT family protein [Planctomycetota bacterium]
MVFSTQIFLFYFLPLTLLGNYLLPVRWRNLFLTLVSYVFYGWWNPWFVSLMFLSSLIDWFAGKAITAPGASPRQRKAGLWFSLVSNLALLGYFKYAMFAQENWNRLVELCGGTPSPVLLITLPVGISFYTFQTMSYSIDLYRGQATRAKSFIDYMCFVSLFPQLVAGPIVRYQDVADQLRHRPQKGELFAAGAFVFMCGFAKKVLLANTVSQAADLCFDDATALGVGTAWFGLVCFYFQLYFDFSGYSDMAIGLGRMLGFTFVENFASPYKAGSFTEFWQRWHLSLTTFLRDYVFIPLGGSRGSKWQTARNTMITFLLGGLWHGAAWRYIIWGGAHGLMLVLERLSGKGCLWWFLPKVARTAVMVAIFQFNWIVFRCETLHDGAEYLRAMFGGNGTAAGQAVLAGQIVTPFYVVALLACAAVTFLGTETRHLVVKAQKSFAVAFFVVAVFAASVLALFAQAENPFLYFRF